jgi:hypothetical protein
MPTISNHAHRSLARSTLYNSPPKEIKKVLTDISIQEKQTLLIECRASKQELLPKLKEAKQALDEAQAAHQAALTNWKNIAAEYEQLDYKEKMLSHEEKVIKTKQAAKKKQSSPEQSNAKLAMKILKNLSPEKQAEIMALIQQQGA